MTTTGGAKGTAKRVADSGALEKVARFGYAVSGVLHLLVGLIAVQLAIGSGGESADSSGALSQVASQPFGRLLLWVGVVALVALALWQLSEALWGGQGKSGSGHAGQAAKAAGKGVAYLALAFTASSYARGGSSSSEQQTDDVTAALMGSGPGRVLVGVIGLGVIAVGGYHLVKGAKKKFLDDLRTSGAGKSGSAITRLGQVGYIAKGLALAVVGVLFVLAAATSDASQAAGLDGALKKLGEQPGGQVLLVGVGLGFVAYGLYSFARTRYARM